MDRKGIQMFLSLLRGAEVVSKCQAMNRRVLTEPKSMLGRPLSLRLCLYSTDNCISGTMTQRGINKITKSFSCPGDCKELSKKTKRSTYNSNQAKTKPWPTRPPTSDNNSLITKRIGTSDTPKCLSNLGDCGGLSEEARRLNSRNQGSSQLTVWQWLTRVHRV